MTKQEFLAALKDGLSGLPQGDVDERLAFYGEMIDDRVEEGLTEQDAVANIGPIDEIVAQIVADIPLARLVKEKMKPKRALNGWEIALIILGFPLWFPLLIAAGAVLLSVYVVIWSVVLSLWSVELSLVLCAPAGLILAAVYAAHGYSLPALAMVGVALVSAGLVVFMYYGCKWVTVGMARLTKKMLIGIKYSFIKRGRAK